MVIGKVWVLPGASYALASPLSLKELGVETKHLVYKGLGGLLVYDTSFGNAWGHGMG